MLLTRECGVQTDSYSTSCMPPRLQQHTIPPLFITGSVSSVPSSTHLSSSDHNNSANSPFTNSHALGQSLLPMTLLTTNLKTLLTELRRSDISTVYHRLQKQHLSISKESLRHTSESALKAISASVRDLNVPSHGPSLNDERSVRWEGAWVGCKEWKVLIGWCQSVLLEAVSLQGLVNESELGKEEGGGSWIKPISRFFSGTYLDSGSGVNTSAISHASLNNLQPPKSIRPASKLQPTVASSTTIVNVEFTGTSVRVSTPTPEVQTSREFRLEANNPGRTLSTPKTQTVSDIFAGTWIRSSDGIKEWVMVPKKLSREFNTTRGSSSGHCSTKCLLGTKEERRISRHVEPNASVEREDTAKTSVDFIGVDGNVKSKLDTEIEEDPSIDPFAASTGRG
jgi:hypothetical protein